MVSVQLHRAIGPSDDLLNSVKQEYLFGILIVRQIIVRLDSHLPQICFESFERIVLVQFQAH